MLARTLFLSGFVFLLASGSPVSAQQVADTDIAFADAATNQVFLNYLQLRDALVKSESKKAAKAAAKMAEGFGTEQAELKNLTLQIADNNDVVEQRTAFAALTGALGDLLAAGITDGTVYRLHCPMANDGQGADWFSEVAEVRNPFLGEKMLSCGRVTEEINKP